jgi:hypothetical protein
MYFYVHNISLVPNALCPFFTVIPFLMLLWTVQNFSFYLLFVHFAGPLFQLLPPSKLWAYVLWVALHTYTMKLALLQLLNSKCMIGFVFLSFFASTPTNFYITQYNSVVRRLSVALKSILQIPFSLPLESHWSYPAFFRFKKHHPQYLALIFVSSIHITYLLDLMQM